MVNDDRRGMLSRHSGMYYKASNDFTEFNYASYDNEPDDNPCYPLHSRIVQMSMNQVQQIRSDS